MNSKTQMKRSGASAAAIFALGLMSAVLLCGASSVPVENFTPQGAMQADLNAGGHNINNVATLVATNVVVSGTLNAASLALTAADVNSTGTINVWNTGTSTYAITSGTATYAASTSSAGYASSSGTASFATNAGSAATSGTASYALTSGTATYAAYRIAPPGLVVLVLGDSIAAGYPVMSTNTAGYQTSETGPGYTGPQWLSTQPYFRNVPIYDFGIANTTSASGTVELNNSGQAGTEYINGAIVGSAGGISGAARNYISTTGPTWFVNQFGANDLVGTNLTTYLADMQTLWTQEHALGANCFVCGATITARTSGSNKERAWNLAVLQNGVTPTSSAGWDILADVGTLFDDNSGSATNGIYNTDGLHFLSPGYRIMWDVVGEAIASNHSVFPSQIMNNTVYSSSTVYDQASQSSADFNYRQLNYGSNELMNWSSNYINLYDGAGHVVLNASGYAVSIYGLNNASGHAGLLQLGDGSTVGGLGGDYATLQGSSTGQLLVGAGGGTGNLKLNVAGSTLLVRGGTNAASGTITLANGSGTITSAAITSSTPVFLSLRAPSGTPGSYQPLTAVSSGTCVVSGATGDNSTYVWAAVNANN